VAQGLAAVVLGFAALWYAQGAVTTDYAVTIPLLQFLTLLVPLGLLLAWQRVALQRTFGLEWPAATVGGAGRSAAVLAGAVLVGGGLFIAGAGMFLFARGGSLSPQAIELARRYGSQESPTFVAGILGAILDGRGGRSRPAAG
jgi:hypothetical protein